MFERFTEQAIKTIMLAQEEARRLGHNFVGTEQILLGLMGLGAGVAYRQLRAAGVTLAAARLEVERIIGRGTGFVQIEIPFTPQAKRVLELSWEEARQLRHDYIATEHLLLGLVRQGGGVAVRVLERLHVDREALRAQVLRAIGAGGKVTLPTEPLVPETIGTLGSMSTDKVFTWYGEVALQAVQRAVGIAETAGAGVIEPEHLLLAVLRDDATIFNALEAGKIEIAGLRRFVFKELQVNDSRPLQSMPFSVSSQKVLLCAWNQAVESEQLWVTKECIFLALLQQEDGVLQRALEAMGAETGPTDATDAAPESASAGAQGADAAGSEESAEYASEGGGGSDEGDARSESTADVIRKFVEEAIKHQPVPPLEEPPEEPGDFVKSFWSLRPLDARTLAGLGLFALTCMAIALVVFHMLFPAFVTGLYEAFTYALLIISVLSLMYIVIR